LQKQTAVTPGRAAFHESHNALDVEFSAFKIDASDEGERFLQAALFPFDFR
jgi:hypothetical protein